MASRALVVCLGRTVDSRSACRAPLIMVLVDGVSAHQGPIGSHPINPLEVLAAADRFAGLAVRF